MKWLLIVVCCFLHAKKLEVSVVSRSAILVNAETGAILFEKESKTPRYPASVTKVATALYLLENQKLPFDKVVKVSAEAVKMRSANKPAAPHWMIPDGTNMGLIRGEEQTVDALLHGLMLISSNDAANVLAEAHSGSVPQFVDELNEYLRQIGCVQTQFCNPHGIHHDEHFTCAYDLALMTQKALKIPKFREVVSKRTYQVPKSNKRKPIDIYQGNQLLRKGKFHYPKAIGVKTGYHSNAMNALVAAAEHEGRTLVVVLLECPNREDRYKDAIRLFEAAFKEKQAKRRFLGPERVFVREIAGAKGVLHSSLTTELETSFYPAEEPQCKAVIQWENLSLPVKKGQKVGEVQILDQDQRLIHKGDLFAKEEVKGTFFFMVKEKIIGLFRS